VHIWDTALSKLGQPLIRIGSSIHHGAHHPQTEDTLRYALLFHHPQDYLCQCRSCPLYHIHSPPLSPVTSATLHSSDVRRTLTPTSVARPTRPFPSNHILSQHSFLGSVVLLLVLSMIAPYASSIH